MKKALLLLTLAILVLPARSSSAAAIAGVNFSDGAGVFDPTPDDLNLADSITVSNWTFGGSAAGALTGNITNDANAQVGRASAPVGKFNGQDAGVQPLVGAAAPVNNIHRFSITIGADVIVDLTDITFDFSQATGAANTRWLAFRTSLDANVTYSEVGLLRPSFTAGGVTGLTGAPYTGLTNQTVDFIWYAGGPGTGDIDIDNIVISGNVTVIPEPSALALLGFAVAGVLIRRRR